MPINNSHIKRHYLEVVGSKHVGDLPPLAAVCPASISYGVEETESEDELLPLRHDTVVKLSAADGGCSVGGEHQVHVGFHRGGGLQTDLCVHGEGKS